MAATATAPVHFTFDEYLKIISAGALRDHGHTTLIDGIIYETPTAAPVSPWRRLRARLRSSLWLTPSLTFLFVAIALAVWLFVLLDHTPASTVQAGSVDGGWTQIGSGTRLQYLDLADGVRCYRMRYSSDLSCIRQ